MRRRRLARRLPVLAAVALLLLVLVARFPDEKPRQPAPGPGPARVERLRLAGGQWGYPSPFAYRRAEGLVQTSLLFDTLLWKDATGEVIPWLARSWERSPDGTEWRFTLRDGVRWSDGRPLTTEDVAFTYEYLNKGPGLTVVGLFGRTLLRDVRDVAAEGPGVVVFRLLRPVPSFETLLAGLVPIIPQHIWASVEDPARLRGDRALIGTGPYRLESADEATGSYAYTANDSYFLGPPHVRRLEFVPAPDELLALERGEIDSASTGVENQPPKEALDRFESPRFGSVTAPGEWTRALHFNLARFPYNEKRFRQAIAYAVDRKDLVRRVLLGRGEPGGMGGLTPSHEWVAPGLPTYDRDLAKARSLLDGIGVRDLNGDGFRDLADGRRFVPELLTSAALSSNTAELVKEYLREVGIDVRITSLDGPAADDAAARASYDMALIGYGGSGGDPDILRVRLYAKTGVTGFYRVYGYDNPQFEEAAVRQQVTVDPAERKRLLQEMQRLVAEDLPAISLYLPTRQQIFVAQTFNAWYFTPGGVFGGHTGTLNKHVLVTGRKAGF